MGVVARSLPGGRQSQSERTNTMNTNQLQYFSMTTLENMLVDLEAHETEHRRDGHPIDDIVTLQNSIKEVLNEKATG
jgi:hypothetical protein